MITTLLATVLAGGSTPVSTPYPVTLAEAKAHLRVDGVADDVVIMSLIKMATGHVESVCGKSFTAQELVQYFDTFSDEMRLPRGPIASVDGINYFDEANVQQTLDASVYEADLASYPEAVCLAYGQQWPATYPRRNAVRISYTTSVALVPEPVKLAILLLIGQWFEQRAASGDKNSYEIPNGITALLANHRSYGF